MKSKTFLLAVLLLCLPALSSAQSSEGIGYWRGVTSPTFGGTTSTDTLCLNATSPDTCLYRISARELQLGANTNPHRLNVINTYTSPTNGELFSVDWQTTAGVARVGTRIGSAGGTTRSLRLESQSNAVTTVSSLINISAGIVPFIRLEPWVTAADLTASAVGIGSGNLIQAAGGLTSTDTSGTRNVFAITPTYNQSASTAANTDFLINRTETSVGTGQQNLWDAQVGFVSRMRLTNTGTLIGTTAGPGSAVYALGTTTTGDDPTEFMLQNRVTTTDATVTTINTITIGTSFSTLIQCYVVNRRTGGASGAAEDSGMYYVEVGVKNTAGTVAEIAAETVRTIGESVAGYNVTTAPSGATLLVQVTGAATTNITWHSTCRTYAVNQ